MFRVLTCEICGVELDCWPGDDDDARCDDHPRAGYDTTYIGDMEDGDIEDGGL